MPVKPFVPHYNDSSSSSIMHSGIGAAEEEVEEEPEVVGNPLWCIFWCADGEPPMLYQFPRWEGFCSKFQELEGQDGFLLPFAGSVVSYTKRKEGTRGKTVRQLQLPHGGLAEFDCGVRKMAAPAAGATILQSDLQEDFWVSEHPMEPGDINPLELFQTEDPDEHTPSSSLTGEDDFDV